MALVGTLSDICDPTSSTNARFVCSELTLPAYLRGASGARYLGWVQVLPIYGLCTHKVGDTMQVQDEPAWHSCKGQLGGSIRMQAQARVYGMIICRDRSDDPTYQAFVNTGGVEEYF